PPPFPYTTLFRSDDDIAVAARSHVQVANGPQGHRVLILFLPCTAGDGGCVGKLRCKRIIGALHAYHLVLRRYSARATVGFQPISNPIAKESSQKFQPYVVSP